MIFGELWEGNPGASNEAITDLEKNLGLRLPRSYVEFLRANNGGDGQIALQPGIIILWKCEEIVSTNQQYSVDEVPGLLAIGSNGAGEAYVVDTTNDDWPVFASPWDSYGEKDYLLPISASFEDLTKILGRGKWIYNP